MAAIGSTICPRLPMPSGSTRRPCRTWPSPTRRSGRSICSMARMPVPAISSSLFRATPSSVNPLRSRRSATSPRSGRPSHSRRSGRSAAASCNSSWARSWAASGCTMPPPRTPLLPISSKVAASRGSPTRRSASIARRTASRRSSPQPRRADRTPRSNFQISRRAPTSCGRRPPGSLSR